MVAIALLGAGIFAREEHLPAIEALPSLQLKAIYSRSSSSAKTLTAAAKDSDVVDIYYDIPSSSSTNTSGKSLDDLLQRTDIFAVIIALPILTQPAVIRKCLAAGKHVLSEKPVAPDVEGALELIAWYESLPEEGGGKPVWAVAENFRFIESLEYAAAQLRDVVGGELVSFRLERYGFVAAGTKYFETGWRKTPSHQGGFLLDGGIHFVAALRLLLSAAGSPSSSKNSNEITQLASFSTLLAPHLPPVDTVDAVARTRSGRTGTITISFGTQHKSGLESEIVTTKGRVVWSPTNVKTFWLTEGLKKEEEKEFTYTSGVKAEVKAFAEGLVGEGGKKGGDPRQTPREALKDLEILQRLLESGDGGAVVKSVEL